jgi:hypothetical protein
MESFILALFCNYVCKIMLQVLCMFLHPLNPHVVCFFLCLASCPNYAILSQAPVTYLGSLGYFPAWGLMLPGGRPQESLLLMGGLVCAACLV